MLLLHMKYIIVVLSLVILFLAYNSNLFKSGFKFENYAGQEYRAKLNEDLRREYPTGSNSLLLKQKLEGAGAECKFIPEKDFSVETKEMGAKLRWQCRYSTGWIHLSPLVHYYTWISADENKKIINISVGISEGVK